MKFSEVKKLNIVSVDSGSVVGEIKDVMIDPANGNFLALLLKKKMLVLADDIAKFGEDAVMVNNDNDVVPLQDNEHIVELLKQKIEIIDNSVVTQSGDNLGEVKDLEVDEVSNKLSKISISTGFFKDLFKGELQITLDKIISIGQDAIVVKDSVIPVTESEKTKKEVKGLTGAPVMNKEVE